MVTRPIRKGDLITEDNTSLPEGSKIAELRKRQDDLVFGKELIDA
jgi:predicted homoserine dehydrogenase-like protein